MNHHKLTTILLSLAVVLLVGGGYLIIGRNRHEGFAGMDMAMATSTNAFPVSILTVTDQKGELGSLESTWPGEIISFGDFQIQPRREGTITEWNVNIGQKVWRGQVIARLSAPPAMPELTAMLAQEAKMLTEARVDAKAQIEFAGKKKQQLLTLLDAVEKARLENNGVLDSTRSSESLVTAAEAVASAKTAVISDQKKIRGALETGISKEMLEFGVTEFDAVSYYKSASRPPINIKESLGRLNTNSRSQFSAALDKALRELAVSDANLDVVGTAYFDAAVRLVGATYSGEDFTMTQLVDLKKMVGMDQMTFLEAVKDYQMSKTDLIEMETEYKLMFAEKETDYAMQRKEIEEQISMLEKDILMAEGRVTAAEASYNTVAASVSGGQNVVAPADGVITAVMKKNGDFVEPGMPIASMNTGRSQDRFVRFKIPSNIRQPKSGDELAVTRTGFPREVLKLKLIGVGTALDTDGSFMADAKFIKPNEWPVNVSVRVMPSGSASTSLFVSISAIEWAEAGASIWKIKSDNTITKVKIKTHRTIADKIEVYEGLMLGDRYVGKLVPELKEGLLVKEGEVVKPATITEGGHGGGGHDE